MKMKFFARLQFALLNSQKWPKLKVTENGDAPPLCCFKTDFKLKDMHEGNKTAETLCATGEA